MLESCRDATGFVDHGFAEIVLPPKACRNLPAGSMWDPSGIQRDPMGSVERGFVEIVFPLNACCDLWTGSVRDPRGSVDHGFDALQRPHFAFIFRHQG